MCHVKTFPTNRTRGQSKAEMDGSLKLIILSGVMLFGSYLAGSIPLFISLSEEKLQVSVIITSVCGH